MQIDRSRIPRTYRDYLAELKALGEIVEIDDEVDPYLELGAIMRKSSETLAPGPVKAEPAAIKNPSSMRQRCRATACFRDNEGRNRRLKSAIAAVPDITAKKR